MGEDRQPHQQPALIEAPTSIPPGCKPWSTGLGKLLTEGDDGRSAVRLIAINATLRAECERQLPVIVRSAENAEDDEVLRILIKHAPTYGVQAKSGAEWAALFESYLDALHGLPALAIEDAFLRWNRGEGHKDMAMGSFYPKPAQLYLLADTMRRELKSAAYRARRALEYVEEKIRPQQTEEERRPNAEEIRRLASEPTRRLPPQPPGVSLKDWAAQCRENGWTEENVPPMRSAPGETPQQMAARLRKVAAAINTDEVGDVI